MKKQGNSNSVRKQTLDALSQLIDLQQLDRPMKTKILEALCMMAGVELQELGEAVLDHLLRFASSYYPVLSPFMGRLLAISERIVSMDRSQTALTAVQFWSSICRIEIELEPQQRIKLILEVRNRLIVNMLNAMKSAVFAVVDHDNNYNRDNYIFDCKECLTLIKTIVGPIDDKLLPFCQMCVSLNIKNRFAAYEVWDLTEYALALDGVNMSLFGKPLVS